MPECPAEHAVTSQPVARIQEALLAWYRASRRDLPWRRTRDPYRIWLSEVMLQQTQVDTVLGYYERFLARFPTLRALAEAEPEEVLEAWAGLGYYRRARHLHAAARRVVELYQGEVPREPKQFASLPGVGPYTAAAVLSIAFGQPLAAVDGNVTRVVARLAGIAEPVDRTPGRRRIEAAAARLLAKDAPGDWNQAVMELGARVCRPGAPHCDACPVRAWCRAAADGTAALLPVAAGRTQVRTVERLMAAVEVDGRVVLVRRQADGLLGGLWDLPALEGAPGSWPLPGERERALCAHLASLGFGGVQLVASCGEAVHRFSHITWRMWVYRCIAAGVPEGEYRLVSVGGLGALALPRATLRALEAAYPQMAAAASR